MKLIETNSYIPQIEKAPHKIYVLELTLDELVAFKLDPVRVLNCFEELADINEKTNVSIEGLDGDKGGYDHSNVVATHGIVMDFRPLMVKVVYWEKPTKPPKTKPIFEVLPEKKMQAERK